MTAVATRSVEPENPNTITALLTAAIDKKVPVETLEKLVALHERVADRLAAQEFADAMARFQAECPSIPKSSTAKIVTKSGVSFSYNYAELDAIATIIRPILHKQGLSYSWDAKTENGVLCCVCTLRHVNGHAVTATFAAPVETSDRMSRSQNAGAALTYARRQALVQVLGLTTTDADTDAAPDTERITEQQVADLLALADEVKVDVKRILKAAHVERIEDVLATQYHPIIRTLEKKRQEPAR